MAFRVLVRRACGLNYEFRFSLKHLVPANRRLRQSLSPEERRKLGTAPKVALLLETMLWEPTIQGKDDVAKIVIEENHI